MIFCSRCGTENDDNAVICTKCHSKLYSTKTNWEVKFVAIIAILSIGVIIISIFGLMDNMGYVPTVSGENISAYKSSCSEIDLNKPQDDLETLPWQKVKVKGELLDSFDSTSDRTYFYLKVYNLTYYHM